MVVLEGKGITARRDELAGFETEPRPNSMGSRASLAPGHAACRVAPGVCSRRAETPPATCWCSKGDPDGARATEALSRLEGRTAGTARAQRHGRRKGRRHRRHDDRHRTDRRHLERLRAGDTGGSRYCCSCSGCCCAAGHAPLYLVGVSMLVVAAALGLTVYVFQDLLGYGELAFFVPVASAILLLALGADYNVFLISRIWREADEAALKPAIQTAGSQAGRAITVAGVILAVSFAAVALIPIQSFREIAFALCVGLLLDTLIARTLLIPALVSLFGRGAAETRSAAASAPSRSAAAAD